MGKKAELPAGLSQFDVVMIAEGVQEPASEEQYIACWQYLHCSGLAYQLQGWFGRQANAMLNAGLIEC